MTARMTEMRKEQRYVGNYPVFLGNAMCATRDMSASGVYIWKDGMCMFAPGDSIKFAVQLETANGRLMWKCQGTVVRTEPIGNMAGMAVKLNEVTMERPYTDNVRDDFGKVR